MKISAGTRAEWRGERVGRARKRQRGLGEVVSLHLCTECYSFELEASSGGLSGMRDGDWSNSPGFDEKKLQKRHPGWRKADFNSLHINTTIEVIRNLWTRTNVVSKPDSMILHPYKRNLSLKLHRLVTSGLTVGDVGSGMAPGISIEDESSVSLFVGFSFFPPFLLALLPFKPFSLQRSWHHYAAEWDLKHSTSHEPSSYTSLYEEQYSLLSQLFWAWMGMYYPASLLPSKKALASSKGTKLWEGSCWSPSLHTLTKNELIKERTQEKRQSGRTERKTAEQQWARGDLRSRDRASLFTFLVEKREWGCTGAFNHLSRDDTLKKQKPKSGLNQMRKCAKSQRIQEVRAFRESQPRFESWETICKVEFKGEMSF